MKQLSLTLIVLFLFSCEKPEIPVDKIDRGAIAEQIADVGFDYRTQLFYDLETNTFVSKNKKTDWDLGFENTVTGYHIVLNSGTATLIARTNKTNLNAVTDTSGLTFLWDESSGFLEDDSLAIGNWKNNPQVFVIDRGYDEIGLHRGFKKILFQIVNGTSYTFTYANLDGSDLQTGNVQKDPNYNLSYYSFDKNQQVLIAPKKELWDICFTQYTHIYYSETPILPYLLTGGLSNRNKVEVAEITNIPFEKINETHISTSLFKKNIDEIGFDWKLYDFATSKYLVFPEKCFIIKSTEEKYFKLHFIDYYNDIGERGACKFEVQEL